jgi:hypothetical protein
MTWLGVDCGKRNWGLSPVISLLFHMRISIEI